MLNRVLRILILVLFAAAFLLLTFFGIGPVLLADGSTQERLLTLAVVLLLYALLYGLLRFALRSMGRKSGS